MVDVDALLEQGAWTLADVRRAQARARQLEYSTRELILTYRAHRLRLIAGSSGGVVSATTLRHLLQMAPDEPLCDACLAFACALSLTEMRDLTEALLRVHPQNFHRAPRCASCRRTVPSIVCTTDAPA